MNARHFLIALVICVIVSAPITIPMWFLIHVWGIRPDIAFILTGIANYFLWLFGSLLRDFDKLFP